MPFAPYLFPFFVSVVWSVDVMAGGLAAVVNQWGETLGMVVLWAGTWWILQELGEQNFHTNPQLLDFALWMLEVETAVVSKPLCF